jgi:short-subunit dehydrogenase
VPVPAPSPDRAALVTGASSGIGAELARQLAQRGHNVVLVARRKAEMDALAAQLASPRVRVEVLPADLTDPAERAAIVQRTADLGLEIDVLVNNAGLSTLGPVHRADVERELQMVELDVMAVVDLTTRFLPGMVDRRSGAVLNVASTAAFQPLPGQAGYGASKAFVLSYSRGLAGELRGTGVTVTALCPGPVDTGFGDAAGFSKEDAESALPSFMWESAEAVARAGIAGLEAGDPVAIPGRANWLAAGVAQLAPKRVLVPLLASRHPGLRD